jgi:hypothetical protein
VSGEENSGKNLIDNNFTGETHTPNVKVQNNKDGSVFISVLDKDYEDGSYVALENSFGIDNL